MANPALKNGYISVANELVEKLATVNIPGNEMRILWVLWRKTWGWQKGERKKDWDWVSYTQFEKLTGIKRRNCIECVKSLLEKKILLKDGLNYSFNQNYDEWVVCKRTPSVQKDTRVVSKSIQKVVSKSRPTKETLKETNTKHTDFSEKIVGSKKSMKTLNYNTGEYEEEKPKSKKRDDVIRLAKLFDVLASKYSGKPIITPKSYFIVLNAMTKHKITIDGIESLFDDWFQQDIPLENKIKLNFCLYANNINSWKIRN